MSADNKEKSFNLLFPFEPQKNAVDKIYDWVIGTGRIVVVLFMLVVIGTFVYRFPLDKKLNDEIDESKVHMSQLSYYAGENEIGYRDTILRIESIKKYLSLYKPDAKTDADEPGQFVFAKVLERLRAVNKEFVNDVLITDYTFTADPVGGSNLRIVGIVSNSKALELFRDKLKNDDSYFKEVLVPVLGSTQESNPRFTMDIRVRGKIETE